MLALDLPSQSNTTINLQNTIRFYLSLHLILVNQQDRRWHSLGAPALASSGKAGWGRRRCLERSTESSCGSYCVHTPPQISQSELRVGLFEFFWALLRRLPGWTRAESQETAEEKHWAWWGWWGRYECEERVRYSFQLHISKEEDIIN